MDKERIDICIKKAKKGDSAAFGELYAAHADGLYRFALWYLGDRDDACDAVQDCVVRAYENIRSLKKNDAFSSWINKILANACRDILRRRKREALPIEEAEGCVFDEYEDGTVTRLLSRLDEDDRRIVTLAVLGGFNSSEISRLTGIKSATVRSKLSRSLHKLREYIEKDRSVQS